MRGGIRASQLVLCLLGVTLLACSASAPGPTATPAPRVGGTLRIGVTGDPGALPEFAYADPAFPTIGALLRCCLARTPLTFPGAATADGGTVLQPDLAESMPEVSRDGRAWTIRLRRGIRYAPPFESVEVTAADIVRSAERAVRLSPELAEPGFPFGLVVGAAAYAAGSAATISGLEARDSHTLVVRLTQAYGGLAILADVVWAPIPEALATGHDEDLRVHWASTGPYMYETYPGDAASETVALVRNPSWDPTSDPRRGAFVDRIEVGFAGDLATAFGRLDASEFDFLDHSATSDVVERYRRDPGLMRRLRTSVSESIFWLPMNIAAPPFDDPAVRRAVNAVINRAALRDQILAARTAEQGPQQAGIIARHVFPDHLTANLLVGYDPFGSRGSQGDLARARVEMSSSRYDSDGDGLCDAAACSGVRMPASDPEVGASVQRDLARIGIDVEVVELSPETDMLFPANRTPIQANTFGWGFSLTGSDLAGLLRGGETIASPGGEALNASLVGARSEDLAAWGYEVTNVPSVDDVIERCDVEIGHRRARCWAELDQLVTESIVPWIPLFSLESAHVSSPRVASFPLDQSLFAAFPALDRVSLNEGER